MEIMNQHGISTPKCFVASTPEEADHIFSTMMNKRKFDAHRSFPSVPNYEEFHI
jgi:hypothetical protein